MSAPFSTSGHQVPVTVVTAGDFAVPADAALIVIDETGHEHSGAECLVCNTRGNVRVQLFELLEQARQGTRPAPTSVVVDARRAANPQSVVDALIPGKLPAFGLRDHTVARAFRLSS